jgi:hypothetical protein
MGLVLWFAAGAIAWAAVRFVAIGKTHSAIEFAAAIIAAGAFGLLATALDFGGWREPDWRAALFAFFGALTVLGAIRALRLAQRPAAR